jgi:transposase-like protein
VDRFDGHLIAFVVWIRKDGVYVGIGASIYPEELKREAVDLVRQGRSLKDVAESLGCSDQSLRRLMQEREILERAAVFFAAETETGEYLPDHLGGEGQFPSLCDV